MSTFQVEVSNLKQKADDLQLDDIFYDIYNESVENMYVMYSLPPLQIMEDGFHAGECSVDDLIEAVEKVNQIDGGKTPVVAITIDELRSDGYHTDLFDYLNNVFLDMVDTLICQQIIEINHVEYTTNMFNDYYENLECEIRNYLEQNYTKEPEIFMTAWYLYVSLDEMFLYEFYDTDRMSTRNTILLKKIKPGVEPFYTFESFVEKNTLEKVRECFEVEDSEILEYLLEVSDEHDTVVLDSYYKLTLEEKMEMWNHFDICDTINDFNETSREEEIEKIINNIDREEVEQLFYKLFD